MKSLHIACIVGARPNFMKVAAILSGMSGHAGFCPRLIHSGQHFSPEMSESFIKDLELPVPDVFLGINGGSSNDQTARVMQALEPVFARDRPDLVLVVGDVNATAAAALVAAKAGIPVAHVEAGLRSFDRTMPEEINRIVTDTLSDFLFTTEPSGNENLRREGIDEGKIFFCGNVMIDTLLRYRERAAQSNVLEQLGLKPKQYAVVTLHRPSNVDDPERVRKLVRMLDRLSAKLPVVFPIHPRTRKIMEEAGIESEFVRFTLPLGYMEFLRLLSDARMVLTDSGGIQEETTILNVPCLTVRANTERPVTITSGTNRLVGVDPEVVFESAVQVLNEQNPTPRCPELWDGKAAARIVGILERLL